MPFSVSSSFCFESFHKDFVMFLTLLFKVQVLPDASGSFYRVAEKLHFSAPHIQTATILRLTEIGSPLEGRGPPSSDHWTLSDRTVASLTACTECVFESVQRT